MKKVFELIAVPLFFIFITLLLFWQFFINGLAPFSGNFMLAWYEPWKTDNMVNGIIKIIHKPVVHDAFRQLYPFKVLGVENLKKFKLPLWNPYNGGGQPLFATGHMGYLNPFNFIYFITKTETAWSLQVIIQPLLIGLSVYYYCRRLNIAKSGAIFAGISFMFSGFIITRTLYNDYNFAVFWMIMSLILIEEFFVSRNMIIFLLPLFISFIISSTQPQIIAYCLIFIIFYFLFRLWSQEKGRKKKALIFTVLFLLGIGISGVQIFPTFELYQLSNLTVASSKFIFDKFLLPPIHLFSLFIPNYFGNVATYNYWGAGDYIESIASIGLIPSFFAFLAFSKRIKFKDLRFFFLIAIIVSIFLSLKSPFTSFIYSLPIPLLSTGIPSRMFLITIFSISVLAGFGLNEVQNLKFNRKLVIRISIFSLIPLFILGVTFLLFITKTDCNNLIVVDCRKIALRNTLFEVGFFVLGAISLIFFIRTKNFFRKISITVITFLIIISGIYNGQKFLPFSPMSTFKPENELIGKIQEIAGYSRVSGLNDAKINSNFATLYRFFDNDYYDPLYLKRYGEFIAYADGETNLKRSDVEINSDLNISKNLGEKRSRLFELTGTKYLIYRNNEENNLDLTNIVWKNDKWILFEKKTLPRAYIVSDYQIVKAQEKLLEKLFERNLDPFSAVLLEEKPKFEPSSEIHNTPIIETYENEKVILNAETKDHGILVLTDNYYPGWKAYIDGEETKILRANYTFRAVEIPPGKHSVQFAYQPNSVRIGVILSLISLLVLIGLYFKRRQFSVLS